MGLRSGLDYIALQSGKSGIEIESEYQLTGHPVLGIYHDGHLDTLTNLL